MDELLRGVGEMYMTDSEGNMQKLGQFQEVKVGIDSAIEGTDKTILTVGIIKEAVGILTKCRIFEPFYSVSLHPIQTHWFKYSNMFGGTNSKRKFRHKNYEKAWNMCRHV